MGKLDRIGNIRIREMGKDVNRYRLKPKVQKSTTKNLVNLYDALESSAIVAAYT